MNYNPPKKVNFTCNKCLTINEAAIHWHNSVVYQNCRNCNKENKLQFLKGELIVPRSLKFNI